MLRSTQPSPPVIERLAALCNRLVPSSSSGSGTARSTHAGSVALNSAGIMPSNHCSSGRQGSCTAKPRISPHSVSCSYIPFSRCCASMLMWNRRNASRCAKTRFCHSLPEPGEATVVGREHDEKPGRQTGDDQRPCKPLGHGQPTLEGSGATTRPVRKSSKVPRAGTAETCWRIDSRAHGLLRVDGRNLKRLGLCRLTNVPFGAAHPFINSLDQPPQQGVLTLCQPFAEGVLETVHARYESALGSLKIHARRSDRETQFNLTSGRKAPDPQVRRQPSPRHLRSTGSGSLSSSSVVSASAASSGCCLHSPVLTVRSRPA